MSTQIKIKTGSEYPEITVDPMKPTAEQLKAHPRHGFGGTVEDWEKTKIADPYQYQFGLGNYFTSEAIPGTVPQLGNNPLTPAYGLYSQNITGSTFTTPRANNKKLWMYKIRPICATGTFVPYTKNQLITNNFTDATSVVANPNAIRWKPTVLKDPKVEQVDFVDGLVTIGGAGDVAIKTGWTVHTYSCNTNMSVSNRAFTNNDGDLLIVPQYTPLLIKTLCGKLRVAPGEICVIPRSIAFQVDLDLVHNYVPKLEGDEDNFMAARGFICEVYDSHFTLPELGPIGANGLANNRHFAIPTAFYEHVEMEDGKDDKFEMIQKFNGGLYTAPLPTSPFDVVGWNGNYYPFKYDLTSFGVVHSINYDVSDPSIFTVLTAPTAVPGVAACDFIAFPSYTLTADNTFNLPYYHVNVASEIAAVVIDNNGAQRKTIKEEQNCHGYDAGILGLTAPSIPHGPEAVVNSIFSNKDTAPKTPLPLPKNSLITLFESNYSFLLTKWANSPQLLQNIPQNADWKGLKNNFNPPAEYAPK